MENQVRVGTAVIVSRGKKVLMGKRLGSLNTGIWSLPGGKQDFGEGVDECMRREVIEETGLVLTGPIKQIGWADDFFPNQDKQFITLYGHIVHDTDEEPMAVEPEKCAEWVWLTLDEIASLEIEGIVWPHTYDAVVRAILGE